MHSSEQKSPVRYKNARFDTNRPYPACISWHCHYQTSSPFILKSFSNFNQIFCFKEPIHEFKEIPLPKRCNSRPRSGQGFTMHPTKTSSQPLMNDPIMCWNSSYQIPKSLISKCIMCEDSYTLPIKWQSCYLQHACDKKIKISSHAVAVVIGTRAVLPGVHWPLWRLAWNNGKLLTKASLLNCARRLDHCDAIASLAPHAEQSLHSKPNVIHGNSSGWNTSRVLHMDWKHGC